MAEVLELQVQLQLQLHIPSSEYSGLTFFRIDRFDLLAVQGILSSPALQFESINSLVLSHLYGSALTSMHDDWKRSLVCGTQAALNLKTYSPALSGTTEIWADNYFASLQIHLVKFQRKPRIGL